MTSTGSDHLTEDELAVRAGMTTERVRELVVLGLLEPEDGGFLRRDVMRARMVAELESKGLDLRALASAHASRHLTLQAPYIACGLPRPATTSTSERMMNRS